MCLETGDFFTAVFFHNWYWCFFLFSLWIIRHLIRLPYIDGNRVGVYGKVTQSEYLLNNQSISRYLLGCWSAVLFYPQAYGGFLSSLLLLSHSSTFKCGIAVAPIANWRLYGETATSQTWWTMSVQHGPVLKILDIRLCRWSCCSRIGWKSKMLSRPYTTCDHSSWSDGHVPLPQRVTSDLRCC